MADPRVMIEQYHASFFVPAKVPETVATAIRRILASRAFQAEVLRAVRELMASRPDLRRVTSTLTR